MMLKLLLTLNSNIEIHKLDYEELNKILKENFKF